MSLCLYSQVVATVASSRSQPGTANKPFQNHAWDALVKSEKKIVSPVPGIPDFSIPKHQEAFYLRESDSPAAGQTQNKQ